jgi:hypothetical protein
MIESLKSKKKRKQKLIKKTILCLFQLCLRLLFDTFPQKEIEVIRFVFLFYFSKGNIYDFLFKKIMKLSKKNFNFLLSEPSFIYLS